MVQKSENKKPNDTIGQKIDRIECGTKKRLTKRYIRSSEYLTLYILSYFDLIAENQRAKNKGTKGS